MKLALIRSLVLCVAVAFVVVSSDGAQSVRSGIQGIVIGTDDVGPLADVVVTLEERGATEQRRATITNALGRFAFADLPAGVFQLKAERLGHFGRSAPAPCTARTTESVLPADDPNRAPTTAATACVVLTSRVPIENVSFVLVRGGVVTGRITAVDGAPAVNRTVEALSVGGRMPSASARSDDRGEYRIFGLTPGSYNIQSTFYGNGGVPNAQSEIGKTFYPGTTDASRALPLDVLPGRELKGINFRESSNGAGIFATGPNLLNQRFVLSGTLRIPDLPNRIGSVVWYLVPDDAAFDPRQSASTFYRIPNADVSIGNEQFEIRNVRNGNYHLSASLSDGGRQRIAWIPVTVADRNVSDLELRLDPAIDVGGHVAINPNARVGNPNGLRVSLVPAGVPNLMALLIGNVSVVTDTQGNFRLTNTPPGRYTIFALNGVIPLVVSDVTSESRRILDRETVLLDGRTKTIDIALRETGIVSGVVENYQQSAVTAVLIPETSSEPTSYTADVRFGSFSFGGLSGGLPDGIYSLSVWASLAPESARDSTFISQAKSNGNRVVVTAGTSARFHYDAALRADVNPRQLAPIADTAAAMVVGRVWKGQNVTGGATVVLLPWRQDVELSQEIFSNGKSSQTTLGGDFAFRNLSPGIYQIYAFDKVVEPRMSNEELFERYRFLSKRVVVNSLAQISTDLNLVDTGQ